MFFSLFLSTTNIFPQKTPTLLSTPFCIWFCDVTLYVSGWGAFHFICISASRIPCCNRRKWVSKFFHIHYTPQIFVLLYVSGNCDEFFSKQCLFFGLVLVQEVFNSVRSYFPKDSVKIFLFQKLYRDHKLFLSLFKWKINLSIIVINMKIENTY